VLEQITTATKKIDHLLDSYLGAVDKRQGIVRNPENSVLRRISNASRYVRSRPTGITTTEEKLLEHLHNDLNAALQETNTFYEEQWEKLKTAIEAIELSEFKDIQSFEIITNSNL